MTILKRIVLAKTCIAFFLCALAANGLTGCSSAPTDGDKRPTGSVRGKVTFKGAPVTAGSVRFVASENEAYGAELDADGAFAIAAQVPAATYKVAISPPTQNPTMGPDGMPKPSEGKGAENVPPKYSNAATSGLTAEVKPGDNSEFTFDMQP